VSFGLEPSQGGTNFTLVFEYTPGNPLASLADRLFLRGNLQSSFQRSLRKLKELLEDEQGAAPGGR
jgi:hypothetical protein